MYSSASSVCVLGGCKMWFLLCRGADPRSSGRVATRLRRWRRRRGAAHGRVSRTAGGLAHSQALAHLHIYTNFIYGSAEIPQTLPSTSHSRRTPASRTHPGALTLHPLLRRSHRTCVQRAHALLSAKHVSFAAHACFAHASRRGLPHPHPPLAPIFVGPALSRPGGSCVVSCAGGSSPTCCD